MAGDLLRTRARRDAIAEFETHCNGRFSLGMAASATTAQHGAAHPGPKRSFDMTLTRILHATVLALSLLASGLAQAANNFFLKIDGIPGESLDVNHKNWIDVTSFSWGLSLATGPNGVGKASFDDLSWQQGVDASTPKWFLAVATGQTIATVTLDVTRPNDTGRSDSFFQMIFTKTQGTGLRIDGSDTLVADASMSSGETVQLRYRPQDAKGAYGSWVEGKFDVKNNTPLAVFSGDERVLLGLFGAGGSVAFDTGAITVVPEPASAALMLGGLALLAVRRRPRA